jgi:hypothetical protein
LSGFFAEIGGFLEEKYRSVLSIDEGTLRRPTKPISQIKKATYLNLAF